MGREEVPFQLQGTVSNFPSPPNRNVIDEGKKEEGKRNRTCSRYGSMMSTAKNKLVKISFHCCFIYQSTPVSLCKGNILNVGYFKVFVQ